MFSFFIVVKQTFFFYIINAHFINPSAKTIPMKLINPERFILILLISIINAAGSAQQPTWQRIDSLSERLKNYKPACTQPCIGDSSKVRTLLILGSEYIFRNKDSTIFLNKEALQLAKQINWQAGIAAGYHSLAYAFEKTGDYDSAKSYYLKSIHIADNIEDSGTKEERAAIKPSKSRALGNVGMSYIREGDYSTGLDYYFQSLKIEQELNNNAGISKDLILIGAVFDELGDTQKALDYYFQALKIERTLNNLNRLSAVLGNIGVTYTSLNDLDKALQYHAEGLKVAEAWGDKARIAGMLANIGEVYYKKADFKNAETNLLRGLALAQQVGDKYTIGKIINNIGLVCLYTGRYNEAKKFFLKGLLYADSTNDLDGARWSNENLSKVYEHDGDYNQALAYYKKAMSLKDTLLNDTNRKTILAKEINFKFERKQDSLKTIQLRKDAVTKKEIEKQKVIRNSVIAITCSIGLLGFFGFRNFRNNRKREKAELSQQVAETEMKALRAQMNPHFLFNALSSIQSFLLNNQSSDANIYLLKFKELIRLVLENSMYREVALAEDMKALELYMQLERIRSLQPFSYHINIDKKLNPEQTAIPPLILQPFVENAIWHGLQPRTKAGGHIEISVSKKDNHLNCIVEDNGVGRTADAYMQKISPFKKESLGIKLTEERLKIINELRKAKAHFNITDLFSPEHEPCGTRVELTLPLSV